MRGSDYKRAIVKNNAAFGSYNADNQFAYHIQLKKGDTWYVRRIIGITPFDPFMGAVTCKRGAVSITISKDCFEEIFGGDNNG